MKHIKSILLTLLVTLLALPGVAQDFEYEGIWYTVLDSNAKTVKTKDGNTLISSGNNCEGDVTIPAIVSDGTNDYTVVEIGEYGFWDCSSLTSIDIPDGVTSIGKFAFYDCESLTSINIPDGVTSIEEFTFYDCSSLTSLTLPNGLISIGHGAFHGCSSLTSLTLPDGLTSIGSHAFHVCSSLSYINIPNGVTSIEVGTFMGCSGLTSINIPDGLTSIGDGAFRGCSSLTTINIPDGVTSIEESTFMFCSGLTSMIIPDGVTAIGPCAFEGCSGLTTINIPDGVTSIGNYAFRDCSGLTSITLPDGLTSIGEGTFSGWLGLTSINIPDGVTSIGSSAFRFCNLTSINIPDGVTSIGEDAFWHCFGLTSVSIPASIMSIGEYAFSGIDSHAEITYLAENLIDTYDNIFSDDTYSLGILNMPNATLAYVQAVEPWNKFQHIIAKDGSIVPTLTAGDDFEYDGIWYTVIDADAKTCETKAGDPETGGGANHPEGDVVILPSVVYSGSDQYTVTAIGDLGFSFGRSVNTLILPETLVSIGTLAFRGNSLSAIEFPNSLIEIGDGAFTSCNGLTTVIIPSSVKNIGDHAFWSCWNLRSLTLPESVNIADGAFDDCVSLTSLELPDSISIGIGAFAGCKALKALTIPKTVRFMDYNAFTRCDSINSVSYFAINPINAEENVFTQQVYNEATLEMPEASVAAIRATSPWNKFQHIIAKDGTIKPGLTAGDDFEYEGIWYTVLDSDAKTVKTKEGYYDPEIESDPERRPYSSGNKCEGEVTIPAIVSDGINDYTVVEIGAMSFVDCTGLTSINIPDGLTIIGRQAFHGCSGLTTLKIPDSVTSIGLAAFCACTSLSTINIPDGVTSIEKGTFSVCKSLSSINIPDGVTIIDDEAFYCCGITSINIPYGVTSIGESAFSECGYLTSIVIPESIQSIGYEAFVGIDPNAEITYLAENPIESYDNIFSDESYSLGILNMPNATLAYVQTIGPWNNFQHIIAKDGSIEPGLSTVEDFEYEGIWYTVIDAEAKTVKTKAGISEDQPGNNYEGDLIIPNIVYNGDSEYSVVEIGERGFRGCEGLTSLEMPNSITTVGAEAFWDCVKLVSINMSQSLLTISNNAFRGCRQLTEVNLPESLSTIEAWAFASCDCLESINLPESLTHLGDAAFSDCGALKSITIPKSITRIGDSTFHMCNSLATITLHDNLEIIGGYAFVHCPVTEIALPHSLKTISHFSFMGSGLKSLIVPESVTFIGGNAFLSCGQLTEIHLPASLEEIGSGAFEGNDNMSRIFYDADSPISTEVIFSDRVYERAILTMKNAALADILSTESWNRFYHIVAKDDEIQLDPPLYSGEDFEYEGIWYTIIDADAKTVKTKEGHIENEQVVPGNNYTGDLVIPAIVSYGSSEYSVIEIGVHGFTDVTGITSVVLPEKITSIQDCAFEGCSNLSSVTIPETVTSIDIYAFSRCVSLIDVKLPDSLTNLEGLAFSGCTGLTSIVIPESVKALGSGVFNSCSNLRSVVIPAGIEEIGENAFFGCKSNMEMTYSAVTPITAPDICNKEIYDTATLNMPNATLASVQATTPWNLFKHIVAKDGSIGGELAAGDDFEYEGIIYTVIDADAKTVKTKDGIDEGSNSGNVAEGNLDIPSIVSDGVNDYSVIEIGRWGFRGSEITSLELPETLTVIGSSGFEGCESLKSVKLPSSLKRINSVAFRYCPLTNIELPEGLEYLGTWAFSSTPLEYVTIPASLIEADEPFDICYTIKEVTYLAENPVAFSESFFDYENDVYEHMTLYAPNASLASIQSTEPWNKFAHIVAKDGSIEPGLSTGEDFVYNGMTYTVIDAEAKTCKTKDSWYAENKEIAEDLITPDFEIPATVTFGGNDYTVVEIGSSSFGACSPLSFIKLPETLKIIGEYAFDTSNLTSIVIPEGVDSIKNCAFRFCDRLTSIQFPSTLKSIGVDAFQYVKNLTSIEFPEGLVTIEPGAFSYCDALAEVRLPASLVSIGYNAFGADANLTLLELKEGLHEIGASAFWGTGLTSVTLPASLISIGDQAFSCYFIKEVTYYAETPIEAPEDLFTSAGSDIYNTAILNTPNATLAAVQATVPWNKFLRINASDGSVVPFASEVTLSQTTAELKVGETVTLEATVIPENATDKTVTWKSDNEGVATVDSDGKVTAIALGETTITATCGPVSATCKVTVVPTTVESITLSNTSLNLSEGETATLTATVSPVDATDKTVTWTTSDASVATVSESGVVTAVKVGTVTITATSINGKTATCTVTVASNIVPVTSISISKTELILTEGDAATLTATVTPSDATDKTVTWTSSDASVATVSANGEVTAIKAGTTIITASSSNGKTATCTVTVSAKIIESTDLTLSQTTAELKVGETVTLRATVIPEDATDKTITWTSSDASVATVSANGEVTAIKAGTATITASTSNGKTATCIVTVADKIIDPTDITISQTSAELKVGETFTLRATVIPEDATDKTITWTSSDASVSTVSANGEVTAIKAGTATITASTSNGKTATCTVTVADKIIDPTDLTLSQTAAELKVGETISLKATVIPEDATDKTVTWKSDNEGVATVDSDGKVTAISIGEAIITATCGQVNATCKVTVVPTQVESVTLSNTSLDLIEGDMATLTATVAPADATDKTVTWTSSDTSVATVSESGEVTAVKVGTATITATSTNGKSATCTVTVAKKGNDFEFEGLWYTILDADAKTCRTKAGGIADGVVYAGNDCDGAVEIPSVVSDGVDEYTVVQIGYRGFAETSITSVIIPESVTSIGDKAFDYCKAIESISYLAEKPASANEDIFLVDIYRNAILKTPKAILANVLAATPWKKFYQIEAADGSISVPKAGEDVEIDGIVYTVTDDSGYILQTKSGSGEGLMGNTADGNLVIPDTVSIAAHEYTVTEIGDYSFSGNPDLLSVTIPGTVTNIGTGAFSECERLTSLIWTGDSKIQKGVVEGIGNPNLLVYVTDTKYAPEGIDHNIVADGVCDNLVLTPGYAFTPIKAFAAEHSEITKEFTQLTPIGGCAGWETLAIPFEPTEIIANDGRQLVPFSTFTDIITQCPFWLYEADAAGEWKEASAIHQGVPYLVSMPDNDSYDPQYCIHGAVKFSTDDETIIAPETTAPYVTTWATGREFRSLWLPLDETEAANAMGLNVGIDDLTNDQGDLLAPGSAFHVDVLPRPLEAYVTRIDGRRFMPVRGDQSFVKMISGGEGLRIAVDFGKIILSSDSNRIVDVLTMDGVILRHANVKAGEAYVIDNLTRGIYIVAGRKITVK